jgi:hypothetical protein
LLELKRDKRRETVASVAKKGQEISHHRGKFPATRFLALGSRSTVSTGKPSLKQNWQMMPNS